MKLHSLRTIKQSFNFIEKNYLRLLGIKLIQIFVVLGIVLLGGIFILLIGLQGSDITLANPNMNALIQHIQNFPLIKFLLVGFTALVTFSMTLWLIISVDVSVTQAVILDQKIKFNIFRLARTPEVLRYYGYALVIYASLIFMACLAYVVFDNFNVHNVVLIALGAMAFIAILYVLFGFQIAFNGIAVGEVKTLREFKGAYGFHWAVFKTLALCTVVYVVINMLTSTPEHLAASNIISESIKLPLTLALCLLVLPISSIHTVGLSFLYKQRKEKLLEKEAAA